MWGGAVPPDVAQAVRGRRLWVAGHGGLLGSALMRALAGVEAQVLTAPRADVDLRDEGAVERWVGEARPEIVVLSAAAAGGVAHNLAAGEVLFADNLAIAQAVIGACGRAGVPRLLYVASAAIYPREAPLPTPESALGSGPPDPSMAGYAHAKLAGIALREDWSARAGQHYSAVAPCNLYGPGDRFEEGRSTVLAALVARAVQAQATGADELVVWGTGTATREFQHADDAATALLTVLARSQGPGLVNVGSGEDTPIAVVARLAALAAGFEGRIVFDPSKPEGVRRKRLDTARLRSLGWVPQVALAAGIDGLVFDYRARFSPASPPGFRAGP